MAGRGLLALLLREAGVIVPGPVELDVTKHRQPFLPSEPTIAFSISHAGSLVGVALARDARIGLDIESASREVDLPSLARRIFNPTDLAAFQALSAERRPHAFFRAWTGKEAVLKAQGIGLFGGLESILVPLEDQPATLHLPGERWHLKPLSLPDGYLGSIACDAPRQVLVRERTLENLVA